MICDTFRKLSFDTWQEIKKSRKVNFQMKEETFTDINMLELKLNHPREIKTIVFNKHEESIYGADWEWWFRDFTNRWIGFRIQAKIINNNSYEFMHLHYRKGRKRVYQCEKLINLSLQSPFPKTPLYCLYIHTDDLSHLKNWNCGSSPTTRELFGCSLISAFDIRKLRNQNFKKHITDVEDFLSPWHCLVCCKGYGGNSPVEYINSYTERRFWIDNNVVSNREYEKPDTLILDNPPEYVMNIFESENISNYKPPDSELHGLTVLSLNRDENKIK